MATKNTAQKVAVLYQAIPPPEIGGVRKPPKPGGYRDSGSDIAFCLRHQCNLSVVTPEAHPRPESNEGWCFPDSEEGIMSAVRAGATTLWANTILFRQHPLQTSKLLSEEITVVGQPPELVEIYDDKFLVNSYLASTGEFTMPKSCTAGSAEADGLHRLLQDHGMGFPVVAKPIRGRGSHGVKVCHTLTALSEHATGLLQESPKFMLEQFLTGTEGTITVMPPSGGAGYKALPMVVRFNHEDGIAPYNGVVAVTANSRVVTDSDETFDKAARECERVAELLRVKAPIRVDVRRTGEEKNGPFVLFDVNMKPNMTIPGRRGREDQASLTLMAAAGLGWDAPMLVQNILRTACPLGELRSIKVPEKLEAFQGAVGGRV